MLKKLWAMISSYECASMTKEQKDLLALVIEAEDDMRRVYGEELALRLEKLQDLKSSIDSISECEAFSLGVRWATRYLLSNMYDLRFDV